MPAKPKKKIASRRRKATTASTLRRESRIQQAYVFRLFVSGQTNKSARAIDNIKRICETHFSGRYQLDVVDVYQQPQLASGEQIIALPTLLKKAPGRTKRILGDLRNSEEFITQLS